MPADSVRSKISVPPQIGKGLRALLGISGDKESPQELDVESVKQIVDLGAGGFGYYERVFLFKILPFVAGFSTVQTDVVNSGSPPTLELFSNQRAPLVFVQGVRSYGAGPTKRWETLITELECTLTFDAAGALAFNTKQINLLFRKVILEFLGGARISNFNNINPIFQIATAQTVYKFAIPYYFQGSGLVTSLFPHHIRPIWIHPEENLQFQLQVNDGTVFPANTDIRFTASAVQTVAGLQLPNAGG
ncbi:MAG: hypothetical protein ACREH5_06200 [Candidatus Omnitrophota bacterium]